MTNLQAYKEQIEGDIQRFKTAETYAKRSNETDEAIAQTIAEAYAILDGQVELTRGHYAEYREKQIEEKKKSAAIYNLNLTAANIARAKVLADKYNVELIGATDQNAVLNALTDVLKYFDDGDKVAFLSHIPMINAQLVDKASSKVALQGVIAEVKNYVNPHEVALAEAEALPEIIGEEFETIQVNYEASLETEVLR